MSHVPLWIQVLQGCHINQKDFCFWLCAVYAQTHVCAQAPVGHDELHYPDELLWEWPSGVFRDIDWGDDPVSLHPFQLAVTFPWWKWYFHYILVRDCRDGGFLHLLNGNNFEFQRWGMIRGQYLWRSSPFSFAEFLNLKTITKTYFFNAKACECKGISNLICQNLCSISHPFSDNLLCFEVSRERSALCLEIFLCQCCVRRLCWFALNVPPPPFHVLIKCSHTDGPASIMYVPSSLLCNEWDLKQRGMVPASQSLHRDGSHSLQL